MARVSVQQLILAGSHFGHLTRRWNPKMKPYIFMEKNGIYIIDLNQTVKLMEDANDVVSRIAARGESILFVGTKKQARDIIKQEATRAGMPYVCERWLGGMMTNFQTMRKSIKKLESYEKKVVDGTYDSLTKKERLYMDADRNKLELNLGGIRHMKKLPGALFIVDTVQEDIAVNEARKLGLPIFAILDTNCDPDPIDHPIPANDDAYKSIGLITKTFTDAVIEGLAVHEAHKQEQKDEAPKDDKQRKQQQGPRRRRGAAAKRN
jgi:small subunit ribosomal protein S2